MAQSLAGEWLELATISGNKIQVLKAAHPRARRLRLTITPQGARLTYPQGTPPAQVHAFLRQHANWLEQKLDELNLANKSLPALCVGHAMSLPLRGEQVELHWVEGDYPRVHRHAQKLTLVLPRLDERAISVARGLLTSYLEEQIRRDIAPWLNEYVSQLRLAPAALRIRPLKSLWGSLDSHDRISLDLALALAPPAALRYVLVHELCHLKVRSHAPSFWRQVEELFPQWRQQREWLRQHGATLKAELDRLIGLRVN